MNNALPAFHFSNKWKKHLNHFPTGLILVILQR